MKSGFTKEFKEIIVTKFLLFVLSNLLFVSGGLGQTTEKCFRGKVRDEKGAIVEHAVVLVKSGQGKLINRSETDAAGEFALSCLVSGDYVLEISAGALFSRKNISVKTNEAQISNIILEARGISENVTIEIEPEFVASQSEAATKTSTPIRDVPQSIEIVNRRLLDAQAARSMQDALGNVTAVSVAQGEGRRDQFFIRGFNAVGDQFIDGVRDDATYYRDLSNVEEIEVVKGPAAVLFGRGSSGGIINRTTKKPNLFERIGTAETNFGSYGLKRGMFDFGQPIVKETLGFRFVGAYDKTGSFRHYFSQNRYNLAPSFYWKPTETTDIVAQVEYLNDERTPDRGIPSYQGRAVAVPIGTYYGFPEADKIRNRVSSQAVRIEQKLSEFWTLRNNFRRIGNATEFYNTVPGAVSSVGDSLRAARSQYQGTSRQENYFNQTEIVGFFRTFGIEHTILAGVELGSQTKLSTVFRNGTASSVNLIDPVLTRPINNGRPTTDNQFDAQVFGVYFQDQITLNRKWKALIGARADSFQQSLDDFLPVNLDLQRTDQQWSPRAGVVYQPNERLSFYTSYTRSFQPSGENLSLAANSAELEPELTRNIEAGIKAQLQPFRLNATLAVFRLDRNNIKTTDPLNPTQLLAIGEQRTDGIELTIAGSPIRKLEIIAGYAWLDARIIKSNNFSAGIALQGKMAQLTPKNSGNLWMTYNLPKQFRIGFGAFARSRSFTSTNNSVVLPGFARFDASFSWRSEKHYEIGFNLKNLTNKLYYETSNGDSGILPGAPTNGSISLRYRW